MFVGPFGTTNEGSSGLNYSASFTSGMSALFGSAAIFSLFTTAGNLGQIIAAVFAAIVTSFSVLDLVIGNARKAREHSDLAKNFADLDCRMVEAGPVEDVRGFHCRVDQN